MNIFKKKIFIVQIAEGLGNQMFCYATARALSLKNNVPLYLDTYSQFRINKFNRKYLLDNYNIKGVKLNSLETFIGNIGHILWKKKLIASKKFMFFYLESTNKLDEDLLVLPIISTIYLLGYWQHEEYFKEYSEHIILDFQRTTEPSEASKCIAKKIQSVTSICLHVRSYQEIGETNNIPKAYLENAIEYITKTIQNPVFFVFSDNHKWVRDNLQISGLSTFVTCNEDRGDEGAMDDLWLMSRCEHHILSSSSFGWWGAWLANKEEGIVIVPQNSDFFRNGTFLKKWIAL